ADTDEHFDEIRAADTEEWNTRLARHGPRQQRLTRAGRPHQEYPAGDFATQPRKLFGIFQEFDDFLEFFLRFVHASYVIEGDRLVTLVHHAGTALAERHRLIAAALHLPEHEEPKEPNDDQQ